MKAPSCLVCVGLSKVGKLPRPTIGTAVEIEEAVWRPCEECYRQMLEYIRKYGGWTMRDLALTEGTMEWAADRVLRKQLLELQKTGSDSLPIWDDIAVPRRYDGVRFRITGVVMKSEVAEYVTWHGQHGRLVAPEPESLPRLTRVVRDLLRPHHWYIVVRAGRIGMFPELPFA
jgi:hypothetical protein